MYSHGEIDLPKVAVLADIYVSSPEPLIEKLNIHCCILYSPGTEVLCDLVNIQRADFLKWLETLYCAGSTH
jgi:hypothetical protein